MKVELEARYYAVNDEAIIKKLGEINSKDPRILVPNESDRRPARRVVWDIGDEKRKFLRIREYRGATEITLKHIRNPQALDGTFERSVVINAKKLDSLWMIFRGIGLGAGSYQETERQAWSWIRYEEREGEESSDICELTLDYWPGLKPILEIEVIHGGEEAIATIEKALDLPERFKGDIAAIYEQEHGISREELNKIESLTVRSFPEIPFK
jgi:hypothetical protein